MRTAAEIWQTLLRGTTRRRVVGEAAATFLVGLALISVGLVGTSGSRAGELLSPWLFVVPLTAICLLLLAKRSHPGLVLAAGTVVFAADLLMGGSVGVIIGYCDLMYCVALWGRRVVLNRVCVLVAVGVIASVSVPFIVTGDLRSSALLAIITFSLLATPLWWGLSVRSQTELAKVAAARSADLHRLAELREVEVLREERARMAGELHDALAGDLAAIGIHAEAALSRPSGTPDPTTRTSLTAIRQASVTASDELRTMVRLLRSGNDERTAPARLEEIDGVLEQGRHRGLTIEATRPDPWPVLPAAVDHAAYRIVQEALTNATKHAPGSRVHLAIEVTDDTLGIRVDNPLTDQGGATPPLGGGMGLVSMRERAAALGGTFAAGRQDRLWRVRAVLPLTVDESPLTTPAATKGT